MTSPAIDRPEARHNDGYCAVVAALLDDVDVGAQTEVCVKEEVPHSLRWRDVITAERERAGMELGPPTGSGAPMLIGFIDVELQLVNAYPQRDVVNAVGETLRQRSYVTRPTKAADLVVVGVEVWRKSMPLDDRL
jgi:hypothetical protein